MNNSNKIKIAPPKLHPHFTNIGYGNPRYNSMVVCPDASVLISCGSTLRRVDLKNNEILMSKQIGYSQIFQIVENDLFVMVVNFDGLVTLLDKNAEYEVLRQFYSGGKEVRHSSISSNFIALSCELNQGTQESFLEVYFLPDVFSKEIQNNPDGLRLIEVKPIIRVQGNYYYPELYRLPKPDEENPLASENVLLIEYKDPNPKGRARKETVMTQKLPIKHKILEFSLANQKFTEIYDIKTQGEILCAAQNKKSHQVYYLHQNKKITVASMRFQGIGVDYQCREIQIKAFSAPHCLESFQDGVIFCSKPSELTYLTFSVVPQQQQKQIGKAIIERKIPIKSSGVGGNFSIKASSIAPPASKPHHSHFYLFNENGLHYYCAEHKKTYSQFCFDITNCGVSLNADGSKFVVADFGGNIYIFSTDTQNTVPVFISKVSTGIPVRTLTWCRDGQNEGRIVIGCVGGSVFTWDGISEQASFLMQLDHTINILRYFEYGFVLMGTSDGFVHILHSQTLEELYRFQAHFPIHYESEVERELFGSMKKYAEIWSIMAYPAQPPQQGAIAFHVVTCCEDQTEKVFLISISQNGLVFQHQQLHHLRGHSLAVTSIDWKDMGKGLGQIYVSCSDDKIVRFRNPKDSFSITQEIQTSTIKEWHTLTYLSLEPKGHRVAIGSQNGYLFIFDIQRGELLFGEKIHLGGIQGMDWVGNKLVTCSSDLCISVITF